MEQRFIVLTAATSDDTTQAEATIHSAGARIVHRYGPRALIVEGESRALASLVNQPNVAELFAGAVPEAVSDQLDTTGRLGVAAWNARLDPAYRAAKARRPGEGLSWDAPGHQPEGRATQPCDPSS